MAKKETIADLIAEVLPTNIYQALLLAQAEFPDIPKDKANSHFKNKYSSLDAIQTACWPILHKYKLVPRYVTSTDSAEIRVTFELTFSPTLEKLENFLTMPKLPDAQKMGSLITYMRRYTVTAGLGVVSDEDDDGNVATGAGQKKQQQQQAAPKPSPAPKPASAVKNALSEAQQWSIECAKNDEAWQYEIERPSTPQAEKQLEELTVIAKKQGAIRKMETRGQGQVFFVFASGEPVLELKEFLKKQPKSLRYQTDDEYEAFKQQQLEAQADGQN